MEESFGLKDYGDGTPTDSIDPVCGMKVNEAQAAGKKDYAGEVYYFCSPACKHKFEERPADYISGPVRAEPNRSAG